MQLSMQRLSAWALGLTLVTYGLLIFGASVRVHGAGLACPDWPLCFGQLVPAIDFGVGLEFGHRVVAGLVSLGFLALGVAVFRRAGRLPKLLVGIAAVVLAVQIVLGGLTVLELLAEWTVASHLFAGNTFCALLLLVALALRERENTAVTRQALSRSVRLLSAGLAVAVPIQLLLGGYVSGSHAGLACAAWPTCDGVNYWPVHADPRGWFGPVGLHLAHRLLAYGLVAWGTLIAVRARTRSGLAVGGVVWVQATIGVANVLLALPVEVTLLHTAGAAALVLCTTWFCWEVALSPVGATARETGQVVTA